MKKEKEKSEAPPVASPKRFNFSSTIAKLQESLKNNEKRARQFGLGNTLAEISKDPKDYVVMPDWWKEHFGVPGLQFGKIVQIAGDSDTGKTSLALEAMLRAQQQGIGIIYVETEKKTSAQDLINKGINPEGVITVATGITEEAFDGALRAWSEFFREYPNEKLLLVFDSYGNTVSQRDAKVDMTTKKQKVGGAAKTNRQGINTMVARIQGGDPVAVLIVNYTYKNIGNPMAKGQVNAGGKALGFFSIMILQSSRIGWIDAVRNKVAVRLGAKVRWRVYKNHYLKALVDEEGKQLLLPNFIDLSITAEGFNVMAKGTMKMEEYSEEADDDEEGEDE